MGLPERIKNRLAPKDNGQATKAPVPEKKAKKRASAPIQRHADTPGLPVFQAPSLPKDHRAILIACASTHRASWAVLKKQTARGTTGGGYEWAFQRNITAVPATKQGLRGQSGPPASSAGGAPADPELVLDNIDLTGFSCGVCGAGSSTPEGTDLVRCGNCRTIQCVPDSVYKCPGCGGKIDTTNVYVMESLYASQGSGKGAGSGAPSKIPGKQIGGGADGSPTPDRRAIGS